MTHAALLLAAGRGSRISGHLPDKVLATLCGRPVVFFSADAFRRSSQIQTLVVVYRDEEQRAALARAISSAGWTESNVHWVKGGEERQDSVLHGLRAVPKDVELVFIHDAARPLIRPEMISALSREARDKGGACLARRVSDTIKEAVPAGSGATILRTIDRSRLWSMETPQVFRLSLILPALEAITASGERVTDDAAALEKAGHPVSLIENPYPNPKLTTASDLPYLEYLLSQQLGPC